LILGSTEVIGKENLLEPSSLSRASIINPILQPKRFRE